MSEGQAINIDIATTDPVMTLARIVDFDGAVAPLVMRERIFALEAELSKLPQAELPIAHHFAKGVYAREMTMRAGELVIGKIHRLQHLSIISQGDVAVATEFGIRRYRAPFTFVSEPGAKRVIYAHEDTVWTTIHVTDKTDVNEIEKDIIAPNYDDIPELIDVAAIGGEPEKAECLGLP